MDFNLQSYPAQLLTEVSKTGDSLFAIVACVVGVGLAISLGYYLIELFTTVKSFLIEEDGTTSDFSRIMHRSGNGRFASWFDKMTYRPYRGAPRGWQIRLGEKYPGVFPQWRL